MTKNELSQFLDDLDTLITDIAQAEEVAKNEQEAEQLRAIQRSAESFGVDLSEYLSEKNLL